MQVPFTYKTLHYRLRTIREIICLFTQQDDSSKGFRILAVLLSGNIMSLKTEFRELVVENFMD
jgi:hypothetical protein